MRYNPAFPRTHYDRLADNEWTRLTRNRRGELNFLVHMDVLQRHITADMDVLEVGAGAGIYTKELVHMVRRLVVSDLSEVQLAVNQDHMRDLGVLDLVAEYQILDLVDLSALAAGSFDAAVCVGGPLSYLLDKESVGLQQILRVVRPGGIVVLGVMSLINTLVLFMGVVRAEKEEIGIDNMRWFARDRVPGSRASPCDRALLSHDDERGCRRPLGCGGSRSRREACGGRVGNRRRRRAQRGPGGRRAMGAHCREGTRLVEAAGHVGPWRQHRLRDPQTLSSPHWPNSLLIGEHRIGNHGRSVHLPFSPTMPTAGWRALSRARFDSRRGAVGVGL